MTIIACWISSEKVRCFADARVTFGSPDVGADVGSKLAVVPIEVWSKTQGTYARSLTHSLGFAFAGSSLIGATTYLRASSMTQLLRADGEPRLPSVADIARLFARVATANTVDVRSTLPKAPTSASLVFGWCPIELKPRVFQLSPAFGENGFETTIEEFWPTETQPLLLGSGAELFKTVGNELFNAGVPRAGQEIFARILRDRRARNHMIGGVPASLTAGPAGASVDLILHWDGSAEGEISEHVLGLALEQVGGPVGELGIAFQAAEPDHLYRVGEKILLQSGINENDLATRESLRDLAVIHYITDLALKLRQQPSIKVLPGDFYVQAYKPEGGEHCYCVRCERCPAEVPLFRDVSKGSVPHPLIGATLNTSCWSCGASVRTASFCVFPRQWPQQVGLAIFNHCPT